MPVFDLKYRGKYEDDQGAEREISPREILSSEGPRMPISIEVTELLREMLIEQKAEIPKVISGIALIDTGATSTAIDNDCAKALNLPIIATQTISTPSDARHEAMVYSQGLIRLTGTPIKFSASRLVGVSLKNQGIQILFGRDFLRHGLLIYHGLKGSISFAM